MHDLITIDCPACDGHGSNDLHDLTPWGDRSSQVFCPVCDGSRTVHDTVETLEWGSFDADGIACPHESIYLVDEDGPSWAMTITAYDNTTGELIARITERDEERLLSLANLLVREWVRRQLEAAE